MKSKFFFLSLLFSAAIIFSACGGSSDNTDNDNDNSNSSTNSANEGVITNVEDTGIANVYALTFEADNGDVIYMNYETYDGDPYELMNQRVEVNYYTYDTQQIVDILYQDYSLYGEYGGIYLNGGNIDPGWSSIDGTFNAYDVSGDTPSIIEIYGLDGTDLAFEEFVDETMMDYNGLLVTVYYVGYEMTEVETINML
ncbi:MAG: hypothetical protein JXR68_00530 [Bacteroidales bacterium]|nr:hypothetical protein [Bacteroidales bacterium]